MEGKLLRRHGSLSDVKKSWADMAYGQRRYTLDTLSGEYLYQVQKTSTVEGILGRGHNSVVPLSCKVMSR